MLLEREAFADARHGTRKNVGQVEGQIEVDVVGLEHGLFRIHDGLLDHAPQLADVARPSMTLEFGEGGRREPARPRQRAVEAFQFVAREDGDVARSLAQGRQSHHAGTQAPPDVRGETPVPHLFLEIAIGRADEPHVDAHRRASLGRVEIAVVDRLEQTRQHRRRHMLQLDHQQRAAVGLAEFAGRIVTRLAEERRLDQRLGHRGAVEDHHRAARPRAELVDERREVLLLRPGFALNQQRRGVAAELHRLLDRRVDEIVSGHTARTGLQLGIVPPIAADRKQRERFRTDRGQGFAPIQVAQDARAGEPVVDGAADVDEPGGKFPRDHEQHPAGVDLRRAREQRDRVVIVRTRPPQPGERGPQRAENLRMIGGVGDRDVAELDLEPGLSLAQDRAGAFRMVAPVGSGENDHAVEFPLVED